MILLFEYIVAVNLSPTILSDYSFFNWIVEKLAFIPAIHNFDEIAVHPEAVRFYIALTFVLLIPKSISIYYFLVKNPITGMATYVITPYTTTKPVSTAGMFTSSWQDEKEATVSEQKPRSMFSRVFWSTLILLFALGSMWVTLTLGWGGSSQIAQASDTNIAYGGSGMWIDISVLHMSLAGLLLAVSAFIIKDYIRLFFSLFQHSAHSEK